MGLHIDHISLASPNIFKSADALCKETGLGYWTAGRPAPRLPLCILFLARHGKLC